MWDPEWEKVFKRQAWGKYPAEDLIRFVARNFYKADKRDTVRILEVGCGPGANLWYVAREDFSFCGIDGSSTAIQQAEARLDDEVPGWRARGSFHVGDIESLPFPAEQFDAVIDNECVYCNNFEASVRIYGEMARVSKPGGRVFSRTFATGSWGDGTGTLTGRNYWLCSEGPLQGKGASRFTAPEEVPELIRGFAIDSIEILSRTEEDRSRTISELLILGTKRS